MALTCKMPRQRDYAQVAHTHVSSTMWADRMQKPGEQGGCSATLRKSGLHPRQVVGYWRRPLDEFGENKEETSIPELSPPEYEAIGL